MTVVTLHIGAELCCIFCHAEMELGAWLHHDCITAARRRLLPESFGSGILPRWKKNYSKPVLRVYGNIRTMTEASAMGTKTDHAMHRFGHKTA